MRHSASDPKTKPKRRISFRCPLCKEVHTVSEWHKQSLTRWKTIKKMPANRNSCWYDCPSCKVASKGENLIPIIYRGDTIEEGLFAFYHITE